MSDQGQRTEKPTQRKLQKSREDGQFLSARDFVGAIQFFLFSGLLAWAGPDWLTAVQSNYASLLRFAFRSDLHTGDLVVTARSTLHDVFLPLGIGGSLLAAASLGAQLSLSSVGFSLKGLAPKFGRLNPAKKLKEIGGQCFAMGGHAMLLMVVLSYMAYTLISENMVGMIALSLSTVHAGAGYIGATILGLLWKCSFILLVFGAIDLFRQKRKQDKQLKMTKQEVKDEAKESDGNPHVKMQIRRLRRELTRGRMMGDVPTATAVLVNPTHYSVAIRYDPETMASPVVVAKGKNFLARMIREKATAHGVPIVENPPLARALYASAEVGQQIPVELYRAVAEILAYLYRMMNRRV